MDRSYLVAAIAGIGGMLGWGLADFFAKKAIDRIGDIVSLVWAHVAGSTILLLFVPLSFFASGFHLGIPAGVATWACLAFFGALQATVYLFVYAGFGKGQVALLSPVFASYSGFVALVSILALGEIVTGARLLALLAVFAGLLLINLDVNALRQRRFDLTQVPGFGEIAVAALLATVWTLGWNSFVRGHDGLAYAILMYLFMTLALVVYSAVRRISLRFNDRSVWLTLGLIGLSEGVAYVAISLGFALTPHTSIVALVSGAFSLPTILLARIFLKERVTAFQTVGSGLVVVAVALLAAL
jgi:drug/metabolite transporter (DMT)-like permease